MDSADDKDNVYVEVLTSGSKDVTFARAQKVVLKRRDVQQLMQEAVQEEKPTDEVQEEELKRLHGQRLLQTQARPAEVVYRCQVLPVQETLSRAERMKRLAKTKQGGSASQLIPEGMDPYSRVYICTHGWKKRKSRGTGSRPRQHIRLTDCPFRFRVQWNVERKELQVKNGCFVHNHLVDATSFATYPTFKDL
ncbi:hypothetical protein PHMEG_00020892, partial [Phytophthora megakarya]